LVPTWTVYVLLSTRTGRTYVGISTDADRRLDQHNGLRRGGARSTRVGRPWTIATTHGPYPTRTEAQRVERQIKKLSGRQRVEWEP
jgi:predicted GIY-YIG superfamily endonuclease